MKFVKVVLVGAILVILGLGLSGHFPGEGNSDHCGPGYHQYNFGGSSGCCHSYVNGVCS